MSEILLDENEITKLGEKYGCNCQTYPYNSTIFITRNSQEYVAHICDDYILLRHINEKCNKKGKHHSHIQRRYRTLQQMFDSIHNHIPNYKTKRKIAKINSLFSQIN